MKFLLLLIPILFIPSYAEPLEKTILANGNQYEFGEITHDYNLNRDSLIERIQGYTTTGEMFFLRISPYFEKVMILDHYGNWMSGELVEKKTVQKPPPKTELNILAQHDERVHNKEQYNIYVKTFDKSKYSGSDFQNFEGKVSGAKVTGIILNPKGNPVHDFEGVVEYGLFEHSTTVIENLWKEGWYTTDLIIEYDGKTYYEQMSFYVFGSPQPDGDLTCPPNTTKINGQCV